MELVLSVNNPNVNTLECLKVGLDLYNEGETAYRLPGPYDLSGALTFEVYRMDGTLLRQMSGLTRQKMMSKARVDPTQTFEDLPAGGRWRWDINLASYYYPLPSGEFEIGAVYTHEESGINIRSNRIPIRVSSAQLSDIAVLRDAPVLDGVTLLLRGKTNNTPVTILRQHNAQRPLSAWYSEQLESTNGAAHPAAKIIWGGPGRPFFAAARFFKTTSFEPTFCKWIISSDETQLYAQCFRRGQPDQEIITVPLPAGRKLLSSAYYDEQDHLTVFFQMHTGTIEAYDLANEGLIFRFAHDVPATPIPPAIRADCDFIHIVIPWRGVLYHRLLLNGICEEKVQVFSSRMMPYSCDINPALRVAKVLFYDGPHGRSLDLIIVGPEPRRIKRMTIDNLQVRGELREMSFDCDPDGRLHLMVSTSRQRLYYFRSWDRPVLVASGQERFFPVVHAPSGVYLGCYQTDFGYRFLHFQRTVHGGRVTINEGML